MGIEQASLNEELARKINREIWNERQFEKIPQYFTEDFVADYAPRSTIEGHEGLRQMVERSHTTFSGFKETIKQVIADDENAVIHFTISGRQVEAWGPIPATGKRVSFDEIVIMEFKDGKVCKQVGVADNLLAMQQLGVIPDPMGFADRALKQTSS